MYPYKVKTPWPKENIVQDWMRAYEIKGVIRWDEESRDYCAMFSNKEDAIFCKLKF